MRSLTRLEPGWHSAHARHINDITNTPRRNRGQKRGNAGIFKTSGSSSIPPLVLPPSQTPTAPTTLPICRQQQTHTLQSYSPHFQQRQLTMSFLQILSCSESSDYWMICNTSANTRRVTLHGQGEPTDTFKAISMEPSEWMPRTLPATRQ